MSNVYDIRTGQIIENPKFNRPMWGVEPVCDYVDQYRNQIINIVVIFDLSDGGRRILKNQMVNDVYKTFAFDLFQDAACDDDGVFQDDDEPLP
jgi:hypothetical protein